MLKFKDWGKDIEPPNHVTKEEVQEMIDDAIRKHNRNASIISMCVGPRNPKDSLKCKTLKNAK